MGYKNVSENVYAICSQENGVWFWLLKNVRVECLQNSSNEAEDVKL